MSIDFEPRRDLSLSFATPIARMRVREAGDINPGIRSVILEKEAAVASASRSNVGGWHSSDDLLDWPGPEFETLKAAIRDAVLAMTKVTLGGKPVHPTLATHWARLIELLPTAWSNRL